jgi:excisionase family DNA binding protein
LFLAAAAGMGAGAARGRFRVVQQIESPYLTAREAAEYLRTTVQGIYSLVKRGRLRPMPGRPGRLLFRRETLDDYLTGKPRR